jgi:hypothetical protein
MLKYFNFLLHLISISSLAYLIVDKPKQDLKVKLSLVSSYCNRYKIRAIQPYVKYGDGYPEINPVLFPQICQKQYLLDLLYQVKYNNFKVNYIDLGGYDSYYTGIKEAKINEFHRKDNNKIKREILDLLEIP